MAATEQSDQDLLVALLDGELPAEDHAALQARLAADPAMLSRLARLQEGRRSIATGLGALVGAAPMERLDALYERALAAEPKRAGASPRRWLARFSSWRLLPIGAGALACLAIGFAAGWLLPAGRDTEPDRPTWRQAVAEYWSLTTPDTLALEPPTELAARELALAAERLGTPLSMQRVDLPDASFRGATLFDFDGRPLVQIAYLDREFGPIAYCVIPDPTRRETPPTEIVMDGFSVVHWASGGYGRMLIGRAPAQKLRRYADLLIEKAG